jgi:hypothetical protein
MTMRMEAFHGHTGYVFMFINYYEMDMLHSHTYKTSTQSFTHNMINMIHCSLEYLLTLQHLEDMANTEWTIHNCFAQTDVIQSKLTKLSNWTIHFIWCHQHSTYSSLLKAVVFCGEHFHLCPTNLPLLIIARMTSSKEELQLNFQGALYVAKLPSSVLCYHVNVDIIFNGKITQIVKNTVRKTQFHCHYCPSVSFLILIPMILHSLNSL